VIKQSYDKLIKEKDNRILKLEKVAQKLTAELNKDEVYISQAFNEIGNMYNRRQKKSIIEKS